MPQTLATSIPNSHIALKKLCNDVSLFLKEQEICPVIAHKAELIIEEALTNVIEHGYPSPIEDSISIHLSIDKKRVHIVITDQGVEFDPCKYPPPALNTPLEQRRIGGMGIHLVKKNSNHINYKRIGERNELSIELEA